MNRFLCLFTFWLVGTVSLQAACHPAETAAADEQYTNNKTDDDNDDDDGVV